MSTKLYDFLLKYDFFFQTLANFNISMHPLAFEDIDLCHKKYFYIKKAYVGL